ncbi:unnamed protein product [marine sediment metagenome]|uniref:Uncharacterized protein n=1 Tax=marine sediment metagenome TaxID=412755 RepID=X1KG80_9ZZZZ
MNYLLTHTGTLKDKKYMHPFVYLGNISDRNGKSKQEQELDENGFYENGNDIYIRNTSKEDQKKLKANCKWCQKHGYNPGKLWYSHQNLIYFLEAHEIYLPSGFDQWRDLIPLVKKLEAPSYQILHILEYLMMKGGKPPPIDFEGYIVN